MNQPDANAPGNIDSGDVSSYAAAPDYLNSDFTDVGDSTGENVGDYQLRRLKQ